MEADSMEKFNTLMQLDMSATGEFALHDRIDFYDGQLTTLQHFVDRFGRGLKKTPKRKPPTNPTNPDGSIKIGRPRKEWSLKRKADEAAKVVDYQEPTPVKRRRILNRVTEPNELSDAPKRGRPSKIKPPVSQTPPPDSTSAPMSVAAAPQLTETPAQKFVFVSPHKPPRAPRATVFVELKPPSLAANRLIENSQTKLAAPSSSPVAGPSASQINGDAPPSRRNPTAWKQYTGPSPTSGGQVRVV